MSTKMSRRFFVRKSAIATATVVAAAAGATASVKLADSGPELVTNSAQARMARNPRACCPHLDQHRNPDHKCVHFCPN